MKKTVLLSVILACGYGAAFSQTIHFSAAVGYGFAERADGKDNEKGAGTPVFQVALSRQWKNLEAGLAVASIGLTTTRYSTIINYTNPSTTIPVTHYHDYGSPAVFVKLFANRFVPIQKVRAYGGINIGTLITGASETQMPPLSVIWDQGSNNARFGYENAVGFTSGFQGGVRMRLGDRFSLGGELAASIAFIRLKADLYQTDSGPATFLLYSGAVTVGYEL